MRLKADLTLLFVAIIWGSAFVAQRIAAQYNSVYLFNGARFVIGALVLAPFVWRKPLGARQWFWMVAAGVILFIASALQQLGILTTTASNAGFITSLYVVLVPFALFVGWREKPGWLALVAVLMAVFGAYLLSTGGVSFQIRPGDALELAGAFFWALHVVLLGKFATRFDAFQFSAGQFIVAGALNLAVGLFVEDPLAFGELPLLGSLLYTAFFSVVLGYTLQVWGQRHTPPTDAALIMSLEAVFATLFGWLFLNELLSPVQFTGCLLIFGGVLLAQVPALSKTEPAPAGSEYG